MHDALIKVVNDTELLELGAIFYHILLHLLHLVLGSVKDTQGNLVRVIVQVDEPIVEEETTVALLAIAIVYLVPTLDIIEGFDHKTAAVIRVVPCCLSWSFMVKHVGVGNEAISLDTFYLDAEDTRGDHHTDL